MNDNFRSQLVEAGISEAAIKILEENSLTDAQTLIDTKDQELTDLAIKLGDCKKIKRLFPSVIPASVAQAEVTAHLEVAVSEPVVVNPYLSLLQGGSATGIDLSALNPNIKPAFIELAAQATSAYALVTGGILDIFNAQFWRDLGLEDLELRSLIDDWTHQKDSQQSISQAAINALKQGVESLYSSSFDQMVHTLTTLSAQKQMLAQYGEQARINVGADASSMSRLTQLVPLAAEELSGKMLNSRLPEQAGRLIKVIIALMEILKDTRLHASAGVIASTPDEAAVKFLQKRLDQTMVNRFRLALAYERLIKALAQCPAPNQLSMDYLEVLGTLGGNLDVYFSLVVPSQGESTPFSKISALSVSLKQEQKPSVANFASSGWPFTSWTKPAPANSGGVLAFAFGPSTGLLSGARVEFAVLAAANTRGARFETLVWLGEGGQDGMTGTTVGTLYCEMSGEPGGRGNNWEKVFYKSREELIEMAIAAADVRGVKITT